MNNFVTNLEDASLQGKQQERVISHKKEQVLYIDNIFVV
jgi:hypothetical protein